MANLTNFVSTALKVWIPQMTTVRFRYWAGKKRLIRNHGYKEIFDQKGLLAHTGGDKPVRQMPIYRPDNSWSERKALFGQNDYIDILGTQELPVTKVMYNVPKWLRGVRGDNELQVMIRKKKALRHGVYPVARPTKWKELSQRITFLYKFMNRKTRTWMSNK